MIATPFGRTRVDEGEGLKRKLEFNLNTIGEGKQ